jgi:nicotinamidase-related amidase
VARLPPPLARDPAATALLVVDMQNDFVRAGAPQEVPTARETLPLIARLLEAFRASSAPVIYTKFITGPKETFMWRFSPECAPPTRSCWPGVTRRYEDTDRELEGPDIVEEIYPLREDPIVEKYGYDAFHYSNLDDALHARHVSHVVIVGTVTQICVANTAYAAFHRGYHTVVVADAVSSFDEELHRTTLRNIALKYGRVLTAEEVLTEIGGEAGSPPIGKGEGWTARSEISATSSGGG